MRIILSSGRVRIILCVYDQYPIPFSQCNIRLHDGQQIVHTIVKLPRDLLGIC